MKRFTKIFAMLLSVIFLVSLCACSGSDDPRAAMAGKYTFYAIDFSGSYVEVEEMKGQSVTLNADGTGRLDWGEDNNGPISEWTADGEKLVIKAGVSVMDATLKDGILTVDIGDEDYIFKAIFVNESADTSAMPVIMQEEFLAQRNGDNAGVYTTFAVQHDRFSDYYVEAGDAFRSVITLNEDGSGDMTYGENDSPLESWSVDNGTITLTSEGESMSGTIQDGVISLSFADSELTVYYAKDGADLSSYEVISQDEMKKIVSDASAE